MPEERNLFDKLGTHQPYEMQERGSGSPAVPEKQRTTSRLGGPVFCVAYFQADGDITIRYEKQDPTEHLRPGNMFLAQNSFLIIRSIPGTKTENPKAEILKCREDVRELMESMVSAYLQTKEGD